MVKCFMRGGKILSSQWPGLGCRSGGERQGSHLHHLIHLFTSLPSPDGRRSEQLIGLATWPRSPGEADERREELVHAAIARVKG